MTRPSRFIVILLVLSAVLFFLDRAEVFSAAAESLSKNTVGPLVRSGTGLVSGVSEALEPLFLFRAFVDEHRRLNTERDFYRSEYFKLQALGKENELLRQALATEPRKPTRLIIAELINFNPLQPTSEISLNKGRRDGLQEGLAVILPNRVIVGVISTVEKSTSRATLVTSETSRLTATLEGRELTAVIAGSPIGVLRLGLVPKDVELRPGEIVLSAGLGGAIPPNLLIGEIRKVINEETASFQQAVVQPFFSKKDLRQVFVVLNESR